jgi:hypothetical protein
MMMMDVTMDPASTIVAMASIITSVIAWPVAVTVPVRAIIVVVGPWPSVISTIVFGPSPTPAAVIAAAVIAPTETAAEMPAAEMAPTEMAPTEMPAASSPTAPASSVGHGCECEAEGGYSRHDDFIYYFHKKMPVFRLFSRSLDKM